MSRPVGFHLRLGWRGWLALIVALAVMAAIATFALVVVVGILVFVLPLALVAALVLYLFPSLRQRTPPRSADTDIIEGQYRVVDRRHDRDSASDEVP
jgi:hypothetical protein